MGTFAVKRGEPSVAARAPGRAGGARRYRGVVHPDPGADSRRDRDRAFGQPCLYYADGAGAVVPVAKADVSIHGIETATMILCGRPKSLVLIEAATLESLGFGVDPIHKTLIPIDAPMTAAWPAGSTREARQVRQLAGSPTAF